MMTARRIMVAVSAIACLASVVALAREYSAAVFARDDSFLKLNILSQTDALQSAQVGLPGIPAMPMSWRGQRDLLQGCSDVQYDATFRFMPTDTQIMTHRNCVDIAQQVLDRAPTTGLAHLVQAVAFDALGQEQDRDRSLALSQAYAPFEGWQAVRRMRVALPALDMLSDDAKAALSADIGFLMMERWGIEQIAPLFISLPDAREFIESVAQQAAPQNQQRLIGALRRYAQG